MSKHPPDLIAIESSGFPGELVRRIAANMLLPERGLLAPALPAPHCRWSLSVVGAAFVCLHFPGLGFMGGHWGGGAARGMVLFAKGPRAGFCAVGALLWG